MKEVVSGFKCRLLFQARGYVCTLCRSTVAYVHMPSLCTTTRYIEISAFKSARIFTGIFRVWLDAIGIWSVKE